MKKSVRIGFPIFCVVVVGGTLIALANLQNKVKDISNKNMQNDISNSTNTVYERESYNEYETDYEYDYEVDIYNEVENENILENEITVENENTVENEVKNNIPTNNSTNSVISNPTEETDEVDSVSDKDKAIAMVQAEWGSDPSVYFTSEGISSGNYIVAVRDKSNTSVKMFYKVNLETNTVEIDW